MAPGSAYMRASDAFTWYMERDPALRSTVVAAISLGCAPDWDVLTARIDRVSRLMPSLRQRLVESPFRLAAPRWSYDPHFDLNWHLRRVTAPAPRTRGVVLELARRSAMGAFDRARPLWELTLVDGIVGGEAALILNTTLVSYAGTCDIGVNIDTAAVPDPDVLLECLREGFAEVTALGIHGQPAPSDITHADSLGGLRLCRTVKGSGAR